MGPGCLQPLVRSERSGKLQLDDACLPPNRSGRPTTLLSCQFACLTPWFQRGDQDAVSAFDLSIDGHRPDRFCWVATGPGRQVLDKEKPLTA